MIVKQDEHFDRIGDVVQEIRINNQDFNKEVKLQNKMLDKVNVDMEENLSNIVKLDSKLKKIVAKSNICCLWIVIIIELAGLGVLVYFMF